jgi:hypothetical protein
MPDPFFNQETCSRCPNDLKIRTMSWFNEDTLCMDCARDEDDIKEAIKKAGRDPRDYEGCGQVPIDFTKKVEGKTK